MDSPTAPSGSLPSGVHAISVSYVVSSADLSSTIAHTSNVRYIHWVDRVAELHWDSIGTTRSTMATQGRMWFVARHEVDYLAEAFLGDRLGMATWIESARRTSVQRCTLIWNQSKQNLICRALTRWAHVDLTTRRPVRISPAELLLLQPLTAPSSEP